ncbi:hypothetical protein GCM10011309_01430 [Litorimonas cladophorae]|uniref:histidine kinase n=1 Tax=Litorimonas cladophorae TaxID=1220491 RepID=A0A918KA65_9PROT|nr:HWE histidine kinase domain-containing protein [Litorimonas cladophorae]GGX56386.1 hypothetical protein GCM10011309_01430 [Litorimonas cladophorae]
MTDTKTAEQLDLGIKIAGLGLGEVDYLNDTITLDNRAAGFFELPANEPVSRQTLHDRIHPDDRQDVESQVSCLLSPNSEGFISVVHRVINADLSIRWINARKQVKFEGQLKNGDPRPVTGLVAIQDITDFKEAESRIQFLMGELAHRSKNMLTVVQGIARLTAKTTDPEDFIVKFTERLSALSSNQSTLVDNTWTYMTMDRLARSHMQPYTSGKSGRVIFKGPELALNAKSAQSIGMALHELATNAVKYGALSIPEGRVEITWGIEKEDGEEFVVEWVEKNGPPVESPLRKGFGDRVIRQMASSSVSGRVTLDYDPSGVCWSLRAPLENVSERP